MVLRLIQEAVSGLVKGYRYSGTATRTPQIWWVDDGAFLCDDLANVQLALDTCWMVAKMAGLKMQVKADGSKTAWQGSYWQAGKEYTVKGWRVRLPDGREVPQVTGYKHLGSQETCLLYTSPSPRDS